MGVQDAHSKADILALARPAVAANRYLAWLDISGGRDHEPTPLSGVVEVLA
jgi:hypothetical protein